MHYPSLGVSLRKTNVGSGVFTTRDFRKGKVIGEMTGLIVSDDDYDPSYVVDVEGGLLEPAAPFRFLNHCCEANAELVEETTPNGPLVSVIARRTIRRGEQVTIDYGWPAEDGALRCLCGAAKCRGWVVAEQDVAKMRRIDRARQVRLAPAAE